MNANKMLKQLLSDSYETESEILDLIKQCFKSIFKDKGDYAFTLFEEDLVSGREYNGCLQGLNYYVVQMQEHERCKKKVREEVSDE